MHLARTVGLPCTCGAHSMKSFQTSKGMRCSGFLMYLLPIFQIGAQSTEVVPATTTSTVTCPPYFLGLCDESEGLILSAPACLPCFCCHECTNCATGTYMNDTVACAGNMGLKKCIADSSAQAWNPLPTVLGFAAVILFASLVYYLHKKRKAIDSTERYPAECPNISWLCPWIYPDPRMKALGHAPPGVPWPFPRREPSTEQEGPSQVPLLGADA